MTRPRQADTQRWPGFISATSVSRVTGQGQESAWAQSWQQSGHLPWPVLLPISGRYPHPDSLGRALLLPEALATWLSAWRGVYHLCAWHELCSLSAPSSCS